MRYFYTLVSLLFFTIIASAQNDIPGYYIDKLKQPESVIRATNCTPDIIVYGNCWGKPVTQKATPLVILNGKLSSYEIIKALDTSTILSIETLKAEKAVGLHGSRGVNGAIYIKTKPENLRLFQIVDAEDSSGIVAATVTFIGSKNDSVRVVTDHSGEIRTDALKDDIEYKVRITSVGYKDLITTYKYSQENKTELLLLKRDVRENKEVIVKAYGYRRIICLMGCGGTALRCAIVKKAVALTKKQVASKIYPNPVVKGNAFKVEFVEDVPQSLQVKIFDLGGAQLASVSYQSIKGLNRIEVPVASHWAAGLYAVQITAGNGKSFLQNKIVVQ